MFSNIFESIKQSSIPSTVWATSVALPTDPQTTIVQLREAISNHEKREEYIQRKMDTTILEAKDKIAKGDKKGALFAMKRRKMFEGEIEKIQNAKMTLETQVINLESAAQNTETFNAMEVGSKTMQKIRLDVGIEMVDDIMDSIREETDETNDINNAIAQPVDPFSADDDELLVELNTLEANDLEAELLVPLTKTAAMSLPTVPNKRLPSLAKDCEPLPTMERRKGIRKKEKLA